jgi:hypothetical protein
MQHMVLSLSMRVRGGLSVHSLSENSVDVFETGKILPGRSDLSLAATTPCRLQLLQCYGYLITTVEHRQPRFEK